MIVQREGQKRRKGLRLWGGGDIQALHPARQIAAAALGLLHCKSWQLHNALVNCHFSIHHAYKSSKLSARQQCARQHLQRNGAMQQPAHLALCIGRVGAERAHHIRLQLIDSQVGWFMMHIHFLGRPMPPMLHIYGDTGARDAAQLLPSRTWRAHSPALRKLSGAGTRLHRQLGLPVLPCV